MHPLFDLGPSKGSLGIDDIERKIQSVAYPNGTMLGTLLDYPNAAAVSASGEIQYLRTYLRGGGVVAKMAYYLNSKGNSSRLVRLGIYSQTDPESPAGVPVTRVAQTNATATDGTQGQFRELNLTDAATGGSGVATTWQVPVSGFYWFAVIADNNRVKFAASPLVRSGYAPVREEAGTGSTLPATAGTLTQPSTALVMLAAVRP